MKIDGRKPPAAPSTKSTTVDLLKTSVCRIRAASPDVCIEWNLFFERRRLKDNHDMAIQKMAQRIRGKRSTKTECIRFA